MRSLPLALLALALVAPHAAALPSPLPPLDPTFGFDAPCPKPVAAETPGLGAPAFAPPPVSVGPVHVVPDPTPAVTVLQRDAAVASACAGPVVTCVLVDHSAFVDAPAVWDVRLVRGQTVGPVSTPAVQQQTPVGSVAVDPVGTPAVVIPSFFVGFVVDASEEWGGACAYAPIGLVETL